MGVPSTEANDGGGLVVVHHNVAELVALGVPAELLDGTDAERDLNVRMVNTLVERFGIEYVAGMSFSKPITNDVRASYEGQIRRLNAHSPTINNMTPAERSEAIDDFVAERSLELATSSVSRLRCAIDWHAEQVGWGDSMSSRTRDIQGSQPGRGQAKNLTSALYDQVLTALTERKVNTFDRRGPERALLIEAWHLRQLAALTFGVAASLRTGSEIRQYKDGDILSIDAIGTIQLVLAESKGKSVAQVVRLDVRPDIGCPVTALYNWMEFCAENELSRGGRLLPVVNGTRRFAECLGEGNTESEANAWKKVRDAVPGLPANASLHCLRATLPVVAADSGWTDDKIKAMGRWAQLDTAARYAARSRPDALELF